MTAYVARLCRMIRACPGLLDDSLQPWSLTPRQWAERLQLPLQTVRSRIRRHGDPRISLVPRVGLRAAAQRLGISYNAAKKRRQRGTLQLPGATGE